MFRSLVVAVIVWTLVCACPSVASESQVDKTPTWSGALAGKAGSGHCTLECDQPTRGTNVRMHAGGLVPNGTYVLVYSDYDNKEKPLGIGGGQAKADSHGWLNYSAKLPQCPLGDKLKITIRYQNPPAAPQDVLTGVVSQE